MKFNPRLSRSPAGLTAALCLAALLGAAPPSRAQSAASSASDSPIARLAWLEGVWTGEARGSRFTNTFEPAANDEVLCTLQVVSQGRTVRYELCAIRRVSALDFAFQVVAFGEGFQFQAAVPPRPLRSATATAATFEGIVFDRTSPDRMTATVQIPGAPEPLEIHYVRKATFQSAAK